MPKKLLPEWVSRHSSLITFLVVFVWFVFISSMRLGTVPLPDIADESFTLQVPYEMLNHGKLALPMYRFLGGNIENVWHSYTPLYFVLLSGFLKVFGLGLLQGRAFNLITAALTLLMTYALGRRFFSSRAGLLAALMLVCDTTFLERSRMLRNDYAAAAFAMLAYYLFESAEGRKKPWLYAASGLAAGAAVMCHTNALYMIAALLVLMLIRDGFRLLRSRKPYIFLGSALAVMSYEIVYDVIDWKNFLLQNRADKIHFKALAAGGLWMNFTKEQRRYAKWIAGGNIFPSLPHLLLHIFQALTIVAIIYLIVVGVRRLRSGGAASDKRVAILIVTAAVVLFHAFIISHKNIYYIAHLAPWFALCVGILLNDGAGLFSRLKSAEGPKLKLLRPAVTVVLGIVALAFTYELFKLNRSYLRTLRRSDYASFEEFKTALRSVVPDELCPVSRGRPVIWLVFPEKDSCYATLEPRMRKAVDIDGNDYALILSSGGRPRPPGNWMRREYNLLGELQHTPYGNLKVYYTGTNPRFESLPTKRYEFRWSARGYTVQQGVAPTAEPPPVTNEPPP